MAVNIIADSLCTKIPKTIESILENIKKIQKKAIILEQRIINCESKENNIQKVA
jgi:hypothetical protein